MKHIDITHDGVIFNWQLDPKLSSGHVMLFVASDVAYSETPCPPVVVQRGKPRIDYARVVLVAPQDCTMAQWIAICQDAFKTGSTVTKSYDDAGVGDLSDRTAVLHLIPADKNTSYVDWFNVNYPGVKVQFK